MNWPYAYGFSFLFWGVIFVLCWRFFAMRAPSGALDWVAVLAMAAVAAYFHTRYMDT